MMISLKKASKQWRKDFNLRIFKASTPFQYRLS